LKIVFTLLLFTFISSFAHANDGMTPQIDKYLAPKVDCQKPIISNVVIEEIVSNEPTMYEDCLSEICGNAPTFHSSGTSLTL
jgi:hypothetical protein